MLAADVLLLLKMACVRQIGAESLPSLIIALLGAEVALPVAAGQLVYLAHRSKVNALVLCDSFHIVKYSCR